MSSAPAVEERAVNVQVAVRCRPANEEERKGGQPLVISTNQDKRTVDVSYGSQSKKQSKTYSFDKVFGAYSTQEEVFESVVSPIVQECLAGFNCTIFAYGQTGTGKTHTMEGSIHCEENAGIVPRSIKKIFDTLTSGGAEFTVRVSFLELYNEELQDLLTPTGAATTGDKKLKLCEVEKKGVVVQNLEEVTVLNANDIFEILQKGIQQRATAATNMNKNSSRSHSIFTMKIMIKEQQVDGEEVVRHGQLNLVDLAGSECVGRSGAKNDRAREAGNINQSLLTLGRVITALVDHHGHIPYRDSKLTRLLQESLGGKAKTCIIATLSPSQLAVEETMSTLDYAHKAKNIKNQPLVNQRMTKKTVLKEYCEEIESLRSQLQLTREKNGVYVEPEKFYAMEQRIASQETQIAEVEQVLKSKQEEHKAMKAERDAIQSKVSGLEESLADTSSRLQATESSLQQKTQALAEEEAENRANQCVIAEQVASEKGLTLEGASLQADLTTQRSARVALMSKVECLSEREARRTDEASEFVDGVVGSSRSLCSEVDGMLSACDAQSAALCGGVAQMLSKGKATCEALNKDIGAALADLVGNTSVATDSMAGKCTSVEVGLDSAKGEVVAALHGMQKALSSWLGEVESAMQDTAKSLQEQEAVVAQTREHLRAHEASLEKFMNDAAAAEAVHRADKARHFQSLQENIRLALVEQKAEASKLDAQLVSSLESRTSSIQATLGEALAHLVSDTQSLLKGHLEEASLRAQGASDLVVNGLHEDEAKWSRFVEGQDSLRAGALTSSRAFTASASEDMDSISDRKRRAETLIGKVSGTVGEKRARLEETTAEVVASVDSAVSRAKEQASSTATSAATLLGDVKKASEDMQAGASSSIDSFQRFLGDQGDSVSDGVTAHFTALGASLQAAKKGVSGISGVADEYRSALLADPPVRSGSTPEKQTHFPALVDLGSLATREHGVIRQESLDGTWAADRAGASQDDKGEEAHLSTESTRSVEDLMKVQDEQEPAVVAEAYGEDASASASMETEGQQESVALEDAMDTALATEAAEEEKEEREMGSSQAHRTSSGSSTKNVVIDGGEEVVATENEENLVNAPPPAPAGASRGRASSRAGASGKAAKSGLRAPASRARSQSRTRL